MSLARRRPWAHNYRREPAGSQGHYQQNRRLSMRALSKVVVVVAALALCLALAGPAMAKSDQGLKAQAGALAAQAGKLININKASAKELEVIKGIGPKLGQAIVQYRKAHGKFKKIEDLLNVKGIGPKLLEKIKPFVTL